MEDYDEGLDIHSMSSFLDNCCKCKKSLKSGGWKATISPGNCRFICSKCAPSKEDALKYLKNNIEL